ncbi:hypothetical protein FQA39_LY01504 [Lamprigera yunnana]|nr:hypothetical protein FQA39_LY01504 [Lamprigera yunnana]
MTPSHNQILHTTKSNIQSPIQFKDECKREKGFVLDDDDDSDSNGLSDSEDGDWLFHSTSNLPASDNDPEIPENTQENAKDHAKEQQEVESHSSENEEDDKVGTAEPEGSVTGSFIVKDKTVWKETPLYQHQVGDGSSAALNWAVEIAVENSLRVDWSVGIAGTN